MVKKWYGHGRSSRTGCAGPAILVMCEGLKKVTTTIYIMEDILLIL